MKKFKIIKLLLLIAYITCVGILIFEASLDGGASSNQSNAVGGGIANFYNDLSGDKTVAVAPTSVNITNKTDKIFHPKDTYKIEYKALPENSTYKSYIFTSSNEAVATVDYKGLVSFISEGTVKITIKNEHKDYSNISDSISFKVENIEPKSIELSLNSNKDNNDVYELYVGNSYPINFQIFPLNATDKSITFTKDDINDYIKLSDDGVITPLKSSEGEKIDITASTKNGISQTISVKVKIVEIIKIPLEEIQTIDNIELTATQSYTPKITFIPADATNKNYELSSSDSKYVSVSGKRIKAIKATTTPITITVTSLEDDSIATTFTVIVKPQPALESFNASLSSPIYVGASKNITISNIKPTYASSSNRAFKSSNDSVATVDKNGRVTGVSVGKTTITVTINGKYQNLLVEIRKKPIDKTTNFDVQIKDTAKYEEIDKKRIPIAFTGEKINLNDYFEATNFKDIDGKLCEPINETISYTINPDYGTIKNGSEATFTACGTHPITITHNSSGIEKSVEITVIDKYKVSINGSEYNKEKISMNVNDSIEIKINSTYPCEHLFSNPGYKITMDNNEIASLTQIGDFYKLTSFSAGKVKITITPKINGIEFISASTTIEVKMQHVLSTSITTTAKLNNYLGDVVEIDTSKGAISMFISETIDLKAVANLGTTLSNISYSVEDSSILTISNDGLITPHKTGITKLIITDTISDINEEIVIGVFNYIELNTTPITVTGVDASYDEEKAIFSITNGYSGNINLNFTKYTTFTAATYTVENEDILTVGSNGVITPLKEGVTTVRIEIDDNMHDEAEKSFEITIRVVKQNAIKDIASFLYKIRKGLGHFGAFLILGIFSTLTYLLYFQNKHWIWSAPLNIAQGFGVAALTEYIQTFVPGRCGCMSDVLLDYSGFMISTLIITLIILSRALIIHLRKNKKNKA